MEEEKSGNDKTSNLKKPLREWQGKQGTKMPES